MLYEPAHVISRCLAFWFLVYSQSALGVGVGGCGGTGVAHNCVFLCIVKLLSVQQSTVENILNGHVCW